MTLRTQPPHPDCRVIPYGTLLERRRRQSLGLKKAARQTAKTPCILYPNPNGITVEDIVVDVIRF